jgi:putative membrane protein
MASVTVPPGQDGAHDQDDAPEQDGPHDQDDPLNQDGSEADYRFTLANERTLLAYLRTALALDAAGLAAVQFLTDIGSHWGRALLGLLLAAAGTVAATGGYLRWRAIQQAMRSDAPLPQAKLPLLLAAVVALISVGALIGVLIR